ncbi:MAG: hypothetical protein IJI67_05505 [Clostridia bacterium]|nr:hypothetical protein [Clostridia bacterium]
MKFSITFIIGATSESEAIKKTVYAIFEDCAPEDIGEIIIVKSQKASLECNLAIAQMEKEYPDYVVGLEQTRPFVGGAIQDAGDMVQTSHLMVLPGDLGIGLEAIAVMAEKEKQNPQGIVRVSRWLNKNSFMEGYSPVRKVFNACAQAFLRILFQTKLTDLTHPVQIMPTALYRKIKWKEYNFPFLTEFALTPLRLGASISEVAASCQGRTEGKSSNSVWQTMLYFKTALYIRFTKRENLLKENERLA